jgi:hypothetical protein
VKAAGAAASKWRHGYFSEYVAGRLRLERCAVASRMLALAYEFRHALSIGTGFTTIFFPINRDTVTSGVDTFCRCIHKNSFALNAFLS